MLAFPNGKINLGLSVTRRREDGYHDIETVFYPLKNIRDALEIVPAKSDAGLLYLSGKSVAGNAENNLVQKAYKLMQQRFPGKIPMLDIYLHKGIAMGAGLGGGSADGAAILTLLNDYCHLGADKKLLADLALELGSDCPFFIYNTPQFAAGRGELLAPVNVDLSGYNIQVVCPGVHVSTADAFSMIRPKPIEYDLRKLAALPVTDWKENVVNDFEALVFTRHPELREIKENLYAAGALYASMSGSGSAVYGIFKPGEKAAFDDRNYEVF